MHTVILFSLYTYFNVIVEKGLVTIAYTIFLGINTLLLVLSGTQPMLQKTFSQKVFH